MLVGIEIIRIFAQILQCYNRISLLENSMKKYLMTVMAAVALGWLFTSCSNDVDLSGGNTAEFNVVKNYEDAFITRFGQPHENQTWGFGETASETRAMTRGHNANANEWADPDKAYGGWLVPDPLEDGQKLRVRKYFQYNQYPGGTSCDYTDFFVQQVYKGNPSTKGPYSDEQYQSANGGWVVGSDHMDHLTAGSIHDHINNFNYGDYSGGGTVTVLDNGQHVNGGSTHQDQIMLMVNSQTDCFGYWNSDGSLGHDDRYRLVSAQTIDDWIDAHTDLGFGPSYGKKVVDKWDRHFIGFDFDQVVGYDVLAHTNEDVLGADGKPVQVVNKNGQSVNKKENKYAKITDFQSLNNTPYVWYTGKLMKIGKSSDGSGKGTEKTDILSKFNLNSFWGTGRASWNDDHTVLVYQGSEWGGFVASINREAKFYDKVVVELASKPDVWTQILVQGKDSQGNDLNNCTVGTNENTRIELNFADKDVAYISNIVIQTGSAGNVSISKVYLSKEFEYYESDDLFEGVDVPYLVAETNQYCGLNWSVSSDDALCHYYEYYDNNGSKHTDGKALDLDLLKSKYNDDYLPVDTKNLREWVKVQGGADGYYSDWIVTICKAINEKDNEEEEEEEEETDDPSIVCRIIVEDLTVGESSDFDFNDVVFDVCKNGDLIVRAIGGELPIYIGAENAHEVHAECSVTLSDTDKGRKSHLFMRNTGWTWSGDKASATIDYKAKLGTIKLGGTFNTPADAQKIGIWVHKNGKNYKLEAPKGKVASMVCVGTDYEWCRERQDIDDKYHKGGVRLFREYVIGNQDYQGKWQDKNAWYHKMNQ